MKRVAILFTAGFLACLTAVAGPEQIIKQRAKDLRDQNNAAQGVPPAQPKSQPAPAPAMVPPPSGTASPSQASVSQLQASLNSIKAGSKVTDEQRDQVALSLVGDAQGPNKLSMPTATRLSRSLSAALSEKLLTNALRTRLTQNLHILLNASGMNPAQSKSMIEEMQKSLETAGVSKEAVSALGADLLALSAEIQKPKN
jgi:hypothetical protein